MQSILSFVWSDSTKNLCHFNSDFPLPPQIIQMIVSKLSLTDLYHLKCVNKSWNFRINPVLKHLEKQVTSVKKACLKSSLLPTYQQAGKVNYLFAGHLQDHEMTIQQSKYIPFKPNFYISACLEFVKQSSKDNVLKKTFFDLLGICLGDKYHLDFVKINFIAIHHPVTDTQSELIRIFEEAFKLYLKAQHLKNQDVKA